MAELSDLAQFLFQLILILTTARLCGKLVQSIGQPPVIGEVVGGILLGPSFFGQFSPEIFQLIFPKNSLGVLQILSQFGLILFMFTVGLHARPLAWDRNGKKAVFISVISIVFPFLLGFLIAPDLYQVYSRPGTSMLIFALFLGVSLSVTAFPVLSRILQDQNLDQTETGKMALSCAAIDDVLAWILLAGIVALTKNAGAGSFLWTLASSVIGILFLLKIGTPFLSWLIGSKNLTEKSQFVLGIFVLLSSSLYFELSGVHTLFGAFLAGTVMPSDLGFRERLQSGVEDLGGMILLPVFFAMTGLRTSIGLLDSLMAWQICLVITALAILGKLGGGLLASRYCGFGWKQASVIGILMNTRGLMELIVLNVGLELGIISDSLFAIMVIMALTTTFMAGPCLSYLKKLD